MLNLIGWVALGLITGFAASKIFNKTGSGLAMDVLLGLGGAFVGGIIATKLGFHAAAGLSLPSLAIAVIGAVVVMLAYHFTFRRGPSAS